MHAAVRWLDLAFGRGDDTYSLWLLAVRLNVVLLGLSAAWLLVRAVCAGSWRDARLSRSDVASLVGISGLAAWWRFAITPANIFDFGGIAYSRLLIGYPGYFATAQAYSPFYELTIRDIEHGILFNRLAGTLTAPLVYLLCRCLGDKVKWFPLCAGLMVALYPLHILFSASDALAVPSGFLAAAGYLLVVVGTQSRASLRVTRSYFLCGFAALSLLTQVRYENALLLVPPTCFLIAQRRRLSAAAVVPGLIPALVLATAYATQAFAAPISYRFLPDPEAHWPIVKEQLLLNPFAFVPALLAACVLVWPFRGWRLGLLAVLPVPTMVAVAVYSSDNAHGAARIFANALIPILPLSAYGLSLLAASRWKLLRIAAGVVLGGVFTMPILHYEALSARYLEIIENDRFNALLANLPSPVRWIIVPDDELLRRVAGSTLEVMQKYKAILAVRPAAGRVALVGLTEVLEQWGPEDCADDACVFFYGLPCMEPELYPFTSEQCAEFLATRSLWVMDDASLLAAPFVHCSIYSGELRRRLCDPAIQPRHFTVFGVSG